MRDNLVEIVSVAGLTALAVVTVASVGYLYAVFTGTDVKAPEWLVGAIGAVVGYFFGRKAGGGDAP